MVFTRATVEALSKPKPRNIKKEGVLIKERKKRNSLYNEYQYSVLKAPKEPPSRTPTYVSREDNMEELLVESIANKTVKVAVLPKAKKDAAKAKQTSINNNLTEEELERNRQYKEDRGKFFQAWGMTKKEGVIKKYNQVRVMVGIDESRKMYTHPIFHSIPLVTVREMSKTLKKKMLRMEKRIINVLLRRRRRTKRRVRMPDGRVIEILEGGEHNNGGNRGINFGYRVLTGGSHGDAANNISGSIQKCDDTGIPVDELHDLIRAILHDAFGGCAWFRRAVAIAERINKEAGEIRCIPGTPISGIWMSTEGPKEMSVHTDWNVCGPSFVFSLYKPKKGKEVYLEVSSDDGERIYT